MNSTAERRVLISLLRRIDGTGLRWHGASWLRPVLWIAITVCYFLLFRFGGVMIIRWGFAIGVPAVVVCAALVGAASCIVFVRVEGMKAWPMIAPRINRQSIGDRLTQLDR